MNLMEFKKYERHRMGIIRKDRVNGVGVYDEYI